MIHNKHLRLFLGLERFNKLFIALRNQPSPAPVVTTTVAVVAIAISLLPYFSSYIDHNSSQRGQLTTVFIGVLTCLSLILRSRIGLSITTKINGWRESFSLVHTAVALGCIPAVALVIVSPESLYNLKGVGSSSPKVAISTGRFLIQLAQISVWAGLTEEIIFRGMVLSFLRRWKIIRSAHARDILALTISSLSFALCHVPSWGIPMSLALLGLSYGLGLAYIATGELILPVIIYHAGFNFLSLLFATFTYRA